MPLTHLGQLNPTKQQQIDLQKALLALQNQGQNRTSNQASSPLSQRMASGPSGAQNVTPYAGPTSAFSKQPSQGSRTSNTGGDSRSSLQRQQAVNSAPMPDRQDAAWDKRTEMVNERNTELEVEAEELYKFAKTLSDVDRQNLIRKITAKEEQSLNTITSGDTTITMPGATDPLVKILEDKNYVSKSSDGNYKFVLPEEGEKEFLASWETPDRPGYMTIMNKDGTIRHTDELMPAKVETMAEKIQAEELKQLQARYEQRHITQASADMGPIPIVGVTMMPGSVTEANPTGQYLATQSDVESWKVQFSQYVEHLQKLESGEDWTVEDAMEVLEDNPKEIKAFKVALGLDDGTDEITDELLEEVKKRFAPGQDYKGLGGL